nr:MAG TPA: hypothetical protein [Caudoviricetes sp.]
MLSGSKAHNFDIYGKAFAINILYMLKCRLSGCLISFSKQSANIYIISLASLTVLPYKQNTSPA